MLTVKKSINNIYNSISYIIINKKLSEFIIIDVGDYLIIKELIQGFSLKGILLTHVHYDHIYGLNELLKDYPETIVYTNEFGAKSLINPWDNLSIYHNDKFIISNPDIIKILKEGDSVNLLENEIKIIETPGHDFSCLCFIIDNYLFTGDAFIPYKKVFTKLQNGNEKLAKISYNKIKELSKIYKIYSGH